MHAGVPVFLSFSCRTYKQLPETLYFQTMQDGQPGFINSTRTLWVSGHAFEGIARWCALCFDSLRLAGLNWSVYCLGRGLTRQWTVPCRKWATSWWRLLRTSTSTGTPGGLPWKTSPPSSTRCCRGQVRAVASHCCRMLAHSVSSCIATVM